MEIDSKKVRAKLSRLIRGAGPEVNAAMLKIAELIKTRSMAQTPVDTGALRASHVIVGPTGVGLSTRVSVDVGGPSAPYAMYVHENLKAKHPVGNAKFLENAANSVKPLIAPMIKEAIQKAAGR